MLNLGRIGLLSARLRAVFTIVFLLFSSVQPAMFAGTNMGGASHGVAMAMAMSEQSATDNEKADHGADHTHDVSHDDDSEGSQKHGASKSCEVHCAPAHAMPVSCVDIAPIFADSFAPIASDALKAGKYAECIRPPRRLI